MDSLLIECSMRSTSVSRKIPAGRFLTLRNGPESPAWIPSFLKPQPSHRRQLKKSKTWPPGHRMKPPWEIPPVASSVAHTRRLASLLVLACSDLQSLFQASLVRAWPHGLVMCTRTRCGKLLFIQQKQSCPKRKVRFLISQESKVLAMVLIGFRESGATCFLPWLLALCLAVLAA